MINPIFEFETTNINHKTLDIILPCFNPAEEWSSQFVASASKSKNLFPNVNVNFIIVNDGSSRSLQDDMLQVKQELGAVQLVEYKENKGKGYAVREGIKVAKSDFLIFTDFDFPYRNENIRDVFLKLKDDNADVVLGKRDEAYYEEIPQFRKWLSKSLKKVIRLVLNIPVSDTQCGLKGFSSRGKEILANTTINRYLFDIELIQNASKMKNISITTCDVQLKPNVTFSAMGMNILINEFGNLLKLIFRR